MPFRVLVSKVYLSRASVQPGAVHEGRSLQLPSRRAHAQLESNTRLDQSLLLNYKV